jgi:hypothetical protein
LAPIKNASTQSVEFNSTISFHLTDDGVIQDSAITPVIQVEVVGKSGPERARWFAQEEGQTRWSLLFGLTDHPEE